MEFCMVLASAYSLPAGVRVPWRCLSTIKFSPLADGGFGDVYGAVQPVIMRFDGCYETRDARIF